MPDVLASAQRILAVRLDNVGDLVMLSAPLRELKHAAPHAALTLWTSPTGAQVAPLLPWVDDVIVTAPIWQDVSGRIPQDPGRELELVRFLQEREFDAAFIFTSFAQSPYPPAFMTYLAGIPVRIAQTREFGGGILSQAVPPLPDGAHQVERSLHLLESAGVPVRNRDLELVIPRGLAAQARSLLASVGIAPGKPYVLLTPSASCESRTFSPSRFGAALREVCDAARLPVVVAGSKRDAEALPAIYAAFGRELPSLIGQTSVPQLAALVAGARLLVSSHSGPMHIADALSVPSVIPFSGTDRPSEWAPRRAPSVILSRPVDCAPCRALRCPFALECLDIPPSEVASAALRLLQSAASPT